MSDPVNSAQNWPGVNRLLSQQQAAILEILATKGPVTDQTHYFDMMRTGAIIDALGRPRTKAAFASVSRSLNRLYRAGLIVACYCNFSTVGDGLAYGAATPKGEP
jgi:hypothetical protein